GRPIKVPQPEPTGGGTEPTLESPSNVNPPEISGEAQEGQVLTVSSGEWEGTSPLTFTYQWQSCDALGFTCMNVPGADESSYELKSSDVETTVKAVVTAINPQGSTTNDSEVTAVVQSLSDPGVFYESQFG